MIDVDGVSISGFRGFGCPKFGKFVRFFVAQDAYVRSYFEELSGAWVLCNLCENGLK